MNKKIKLTDLKVKSFVTALSEEEKAIAKGGAFTDILGDNVPQSISICPQGGANSMCKVGSICAPFQLTKYLTCEYCSKGPN